MTRENHKTYIVMPDMDAGMLSPEDLEKIADVVKRYNVPRTKITGAQRIAFLGIEPQQLESLQKELNTPAKPPHKNGRLHYIQACPGNTWCKYGVGDTLHLHDRLKKLELQNPLPSKVKVGISGCRMCCCESWVRDVGLVAEKNGWRFTFGGNGGGRPRIGDIVADGLTEDEAVALIEKTLLYYSTTAQFKTRSARFMERVGIETLQKAVLF